MSSESEIIPRGVIIKRAIAEVAKEHGVTFDDIMSASRRRHIVDARTSAIKRIKADFGYLSLTQIGLIFDRDHTTILYALRKPDITP